MTLTPLGAEVGAGEAPSFARDTDPTPFTPILERFLVRVPGALGAVLVDLEGETVDYVGKVSAFDLRVSAAHARILLFEVHTFAKLGEPRALVVRGERQGLVARVLEDGYALVVLLAPWAAFAVPARALAFCERELALEAGWTTPTSLRGPPSSARASSSAGLREDAFFPVHVDTDARGRPVRVGALAVAGESATTVPVEVLGAIGGPDARARIRARGAAIATPNAPAHGFRVRTAEGRELTLVREAKRFWYADEPLVRPLPHR